MSAEDPIEPSIAFAAEHHVEDEQKCAGGAVVELDGVAEGVYAAEEDEKELTEAQSLGKTTHKSKGKQADEQPRKRRKLSHDSEELMFSRAPRAEAQDASDSAGPSTSAVNDVKNGESLPALRQMVLGKTALTDAHKQCVWHTSPCILY